MEVNYASKGAFQSFYSRREQYEQNLRHPKAVQKSPQTKKFIAGAALMGAVIPVMAINIAKGRGQDFLDTFKKNGVKNKLEAAANLFEIDSFKGIFAANTGAVAAGVAAGNLSEKNSENKKAKCWEGVFEFLNGIIPTCFAALGESTGKFKSPPAKAALIGASVASGMYTANKTSNLINKKCLDGKQTRRFKLSDCLVHVDDILAIFVLAKIPLAKSIKADKILPLLYAHAGLEAGCAEKSEKSEKSERAEKAGPFV